MVYGDMVDVANLIRSEGWETLSCTITDIHDDNGIHGQALYLHLKMHIFGNRVFTSRRWGEQSLNGIWEEMLGRLQGHVRVSLPIKSRPVSMFGVHRVTGLEPAGLQDLPER